jgi:hypothetical protein
LRKIRVAINRGERAMVLNCAKAMEVSCEVKLQEICYFIITEGGTVLTLMKATASHLQMLNEEVDCYCEAKVAKHQAVSLKKYMPKI